MVSEDLALWIHSNYKNKNNIYEIN
jgi:hypothetical protein